MSVTNTLSSISYSNEVQYVPGEARLRTSQQKAEMASCECLSARCIFECTRPQDERVHRRKHVSNEATYFTSCRRFGLTVLGHYMGRDAGHYADCPSR